MKHVVVLLLFVVVIVSCAYGSFWNVCSGVEQKVDNGEFQIRQDGEGWFIYAPPGFAQSTEYISHFAGLLGKRISSAPDGWEKFKLTGSCGGSTIVEYWASKKGLGPDGKSWRGSDYGGPIVDYGMFTIIGAVLVVVVGTAAMLFRRSVAFG